MVVGIGVIAGVECVVMGNDPSVLGGAPTPYAIKKWMRAIEIADNRIPYISFVESAGADPGSTWRGRDRGRRRRAQTEHFAESGRAFYEMIELSKLGIPTVCVVFGSSTGRCLPAGLSDYVVVIEERLKIFLAGPPLVKMATGEESDDDVGGAQLHAECRAWATTWPLTRWTPSGQLRGGLAPQLAQGWAGASRTSRTRSMTPSCSRQPRPAPAGRRET